MSTSLRTYLVFGFMVLAACGDEGTGTSGTVGPYPGGSGAAGSAPPPVPPPPIRTATLIVENRYSNLTITGVFLSPSYEDKWGANQLSGSLLLPGKDLTLRQIPCDDYYDLKITGSGGATIGKVSELYFACGVTKSVTLSR